MTKPFPEWTLDLCQRMRPAPTAMARGIRVRFAGSLARSRECPTPKMVRDLGAPDREAATNEKTSFGTQKIVPLLYGIVVDQKTGGDNVDHSNKPPVQPGGNADSLCLESRGTGAPIESGESTASRRRPVLRWRWPWRGIAAQPP